ncbi:unnamed protein product [Paramecium pentaurelia]|uniref:C2H2-type domain-containing protein n=1 Tax=Paramecium pentaurelia TaxID=43138 RepID=A0A8S1XM05_9CILI|nr:unnamed protein product [Paramecium pentaurelia]
MSKLTLYKDDNYNLRDDFDIDQLTFSQSHLFSQHENINQKIQKFQIFNPQHQATLGFIKLDGKIKYDISLQINHKTISKNKQKHENPHQCPFCEKKFQSSQAVGGHLSRTHPDQSQNYKFKVAKREERKYELERTRQLQYIVQNDLDLL